MATPVVAEQQYSCEARHDRGTDSVIGDFRGSILAVTPASGEREVRGGVSIPGPVHVARRAWAARVARPHREAVRPHRLTGGAPAERRGGAVALRELPGL